MAFDYKKLWYIAVKLKTYHRHDLWEVLKENDIDDMLLKIFAVVQIKM